MYIVTKDGKAMVNLSHVTSLYIGANGITLKADFDNGKGCQIGAYDSEEECKRAIHIIAQAMGKAGYFLAPAKEDVKK